VVACVAVRGDAPSAGVKQLQEAKEVQLRAGIGVQAAACCAARGRRGSMRRVPGSNNRGGEGRWWCCPPWAAVTGDGAVMR